jgi:ribonuclease BN (tRNA processing enzyme)
MDITLLGTGTAIPVKDHSPSGLIVMAAGKYFLFDIGPGTLGRLHLAGIGFDQIDHLFISHLHPDHTLDLAMLLLVFNYAPGAQRTKPFQITGCRGLEFFYNRLLVLYPEITPLSYELQFREVHQEEFSLEDMTIKCAPTGHTPESVAYRLEHERRSLVYSGDAAPTGGLASLAQSADMLISECSFPSGWETRDHLNADSLGEIAQMAGVTTLVIVHSYPPALAADLITQIRVRYKGDVRLGIDGMRLAV